MDKSVDLFIGWCLRNVFAIPEDLRLVLVGPFRTAGVALEIKND